MTYHRNPHAFTLSQKIVILISVVTFMALLPSSLFTIDKVRQIVYDRVSINAVSINTILCHSDEIIKSIKSADPSSCDAIDDKMTQFVNTVDNSDEASVAIFDVHKHLRVLYNPNDIPEFQSNARKLLEKYAHLDHVTWKENYDIPYQAFGIIKDNHNVTVGYVVTGYSDGILNKSTLDAVVFLMFTACLGLIIGVVCAVYLGRHVKKVLFGLEPEEIAALLKERDILINSVREGIITIDNNGKITLVNDEAKSMIRDANILDSSNLIGKELKYILSKVSFDDIIKQGRRVTDVSAKIGRDVFIATAVPLLLNSKIIGAVITFRKKAVVEEMANQITGFKNYVAALRAQTHEFMNKMHVIMGLIDMKAYDELKKYTQEIAYNRQSEVSFIMTRMKDITLAGFILAKISRSHELDIEFSLSEESDLRSELDVPSVHDLVLIIGNLLENSFDALKNFDGERIVNLSVLDFGRELVIVVEDSGPGMTKETINKIFVRGFTSKGDSHGFGLYLVKKSVDSLNGTITVESSPGEGTTFTVRLPMKKDGGNVD